MEMEFNEQIRLPNICMIIVVFVIICWTPLVGMKLEAMFFPSFFSFIVELEASLLEMWQI